jgi:hypothetical protein
MRREFAFRWRDFIDRFVQTQGSCTTTTFVFGSITWDLCCDNKRECFS